MKLIGSLVYFGVITFVHSAEILSVLPLFGQSHWNVIDSILQTLVSSGHNVTAITPFLKKKKIYNYTEIDSSSYMNKIEAINYNLVADDNGYSYLNAAHLKSCENLYKSKDFWKTLENHKFDLVIGHFLASTCYSYIAYKLQVPMIYVTSDAMNARLHSLLVNPLNPSYIASPNIPMALPTSFCQRLENFFNKMYVNIYYWWLDRKATTIGKTYFGKNAPDASSLFKSTTVLMFINSYFTFETSRPMIPNLIQIGGIHVSQPKPLPEDIKQFIEDSPDGVIYFSFGSIVKMDTLPKTMQQAFKEAFSELPQRILWKFESDEMANQPKNVMIKKWFPQRDILSHPNVKLFIYHGGLSGVNEAIQNKVPILGIPIFTDQFKNIANCVHKGISISLDHNNLNKLIILNAIKDMIGNPKYKNKALELFDKFNDRPVTPKQLVIYWTNYVLKFYKHEMFQNAADLEWFKYYMFDIVTLLLSSILLLVYVLRYFIEN
ncbi:UDP-glucosyltransferase 2-like [Daktulosphaira vitifoliae]|uniref:UDP-glucosyltransferase 2-like n=1 Tax=Daktulosphaira vitifoliae TaxID=58002 RepID=UPI0021AA34FE|nr:UDP-glucosyltransferase 2-like [Daktulosphaira vitifoliae]